MGNDSKRRVGRPKGHPQTGPLVLEGSQARARIDVDLGEDTAEELKEYARWVELSSSLATGNAVSATVDYALCELFRRDRLWRAKKRGTEPQEVTAVTGGSSSPPPPPNGSGAGRGTSGRPA
jgi:hypothetical protein